MMLRGSASPKSILCLLLFLRRNGQAEHGKLPGSGDVHPTRILWIGQVQRMAEFAAIDFPVWAPGFLDVPALPLEHIGGVEPALQVPAAELALFVFFIAGTLARLLDLDFVVGELRDFYRL